MIRRRWRPSRARPLVAHLTTTDISLQLLLGPQLRAFAASGYEVVGVSQPGPFSRQLEREGIAHFPLVNATRSMSLRADLKAAVELWMLLRRLRPDILHTHNPKPGVYGRIVGALLGIPVVVNTVHGLYTTPDDKWTRRFIVYSLERLAAAFSDAELVQNPEDIETLRGLRVPSRRLHLLGNGIDLSRFSSGGETGGMRRRLRAEWGARRDTVVVLAVGRLVYEKGYGDLIAAASMLRHQAPEAMLVIAGPAEPSKADGLTESEMRAATALGIRLLGHRDDMEHLYAAADLYVLASHREGFPRSAMEAAAMGLPIVATDIRGCRQVVEDSKTGLLVPPRDPEALASAIAELARDPSRRRSMCALAREKARREFDQDQVIQATLGIYSRLLSQRG